ncbi:DUF3817 domain-containing protein [Nocardioides sp. AE5]|uniref:DUF3817 domain-containing protein n=1 Tax=Nocardioides sp. AE5 TaxID=2962573 RepID=UPI002880CD29|nr:DUF3817 domain-containing protein [Nocardioides sp. AE5]MDT0203859.1 DUF3817 domain-containing protein [Nocardioides sp. AE5]
MSPQRLFRIVAVAEAITWAALLGGMFLKYVTETTEMGVRIGGALHGFVFVAYCLATVVVGIDQRWPLRRTVIGLLAAVPPFFTVWFDLAAERKGWFAAGWRLRSDAPATVAEKATGLLVRNPARGLAAALVAVVALFGLALLVGPPAS